ncbi:MAG: hypothetical protein QOF79_1620 [Actinomycetota bacterium]|jgi:uncharacterized protein (DUF305 family)|nr:hypothetical protein [Actinomycetota bacterium]
MDQEKSASGGLRTRRTIAIVVAVFVLVFGAFAVGRISTQQTVTPTDTSAEAGFARDMQVHHDQAVEMSMMVRDETTDPDVRRLAYDIALGQSQGAGQLYGYLADWNLPQSSSQPPMTWMTLPPLSGAGGTHNHGGATLKEPLATMPGYATDAQIAKLASLKGVPAEQEFLTLMIAHHRGGIEMAQYVLARSTYPPIVTFARSLVSVQTSEITNMQAMLAALPRTAVPTTK